MALGAFLGLLVLKGEAFGETKPVATGRTVTA
jgi:hypothetical protein